MDEKLVIAIKAALEASEEILKIYNSNNFGVKFKQDRSPLTVADKKSHNIIYKHLKETNIPILSEEGKNIKYQVRKNWREFWLIDPIDGTKEFINKNGEFTVNIALINDSSPILGVVYIPVEKSLYIADKNIGSYKIENIETVDELFNANFINLSLSNDPEKFTVIVSKSHMNEKTQNFVNQLEKKYNKIETISFGSSLKICKVAEGSANCYPRFGPTMEWDIAAAHAVAKFAGCIIVQEDLSSSIEYNKENLLNPYFIVKRNE